METVSDEAFVLHSKPFSDSRVLLQLFTKSHGRISALFRLPSKKHTFRPRPFIHLVSHWRGSKNLKTITLLEPSHSAFHLEANALYCGMYLNEILQRVIKTEEPFEQLFESYIETLSYLASGEELDIALRRFEIFLLNDLGYGVDLTQDINGVPIEDSREQFYIFKLNQGFAKILGREKRLGNHSLSGQSIRAFSRYDFSDNETRQTAKKICRAALVPLIGLKPLASRELFQKGCDK